MPLTVKVKRPTCSLGQKNIFEVLKQSLDDTNNKNSKDPVTTRNLREAASQSIKVKNIYNFF